MTEFVRKIANEKVKMREGDDTREITRMEALVRILFQKAMKGDQKAIASYLNLMREAGLSSDPSDEPHCGLIAVPLRSDTIEQWEERHKNTKAPFDDRTMEIEKQNAVKMAETGKASPDDEG